MATFSTSVNVLEKYNPFPVDGGTGLDSIKRGIYGEGSLSIYSKKYYVFEVKFQKHCT